MPDLRLQKPLEDYIEYWETLNARSIRLIEKLAEPGLMFSDPFNDVQGLDAVEDILSKMFEDTDNPVFKVRDYAWGQDGLTAYLRWTFTFSPKGKKERWSIEGMSEITFSNEAKVMVHKDHWDSGSQFLARLPFIGALVRFVQNKLAV